MNKLYPYSILFALFLAFSCKKSNTNISSSQLAVTNLSSTVVFQQLENGYNKYRIPALLNTKQGTLLAFCEGYKNPIVNDIEVIFKRSTDNGLTWSDQHVVFSDGPNICGNPTLVQDKKTNTIWLFMCNNSVKETEHQIITTSDFLGRTVWISKSDDDGITWSAPKNITTMVKSPNWGWYATGPGIGVQIMNGPHAGRLVIPCDHSYILNGVPVYRSHTIYSDDDGETWTIGGSSGYNANECQVVELNTGNGTLLMNSRNLVSPYTRAQAVSYDGGETWLNPELVNSLIDPNCEGSIVSYNRNILLFSNNASKSRTNLTLKSSIDNGLTWDYAYTINKGFSGYSSLSVLNNGDIACLFEAGSQKLYENITFNTFHATQK